MGEKTCVFYLTIKRKKTYYVKSTQTKFPRDLFYASEYEFL